MTSTGRNVGLLAACQAMLFTNNTTLVAINGLAGLALTPVKALATLPVTCWILGGAIATMPASLHMKRVGRQRGLTQGVYWGIAGALACGGAMWLQSFWTLIWGVFNAYGQYYRFAAADAASADFRPTAISLVLAGGLVGGILGPGVSRWTIDLFDVRFMGSYLSLTAFALATVALLRFIRIPPPAAGEQSSSGRPLLQIAVQPRFIVAVLCGATSYGVMNFLMTSTPIAMGVCGHPYADAAFVISAHVVGMFAPSFVTGSLIRRLGLAPVMLAGVLLNFASIGTALSGVSVAQFWWALVLLGIGWNFTYIGGTTLLTEAYRPEERAKAQGANEIAIFAVQAISAFSSGVLVNARGWDTLNYVALPLVVLAGAAIAWLAWRRASMMPA